MERNGENVRKENVGNEQRQAKEGEREKEERISERE
jgi:hypothetical protein